MSNALFEQNGETVVLTTLQYLWLEYPTYDMLFSGHTGKSAYLCRNIIGGVVRMLTDSVVRASADGKTGENVPISRIESDIEKYIFDGYSTSPE